MKGKSLLVLSIFALAACGRSAPQGNWNGNNDYGGGPDRTSSNDNNGVGGKTSSSGNNGVADLVAPTNPFNFGGVEKEDVVNYLQRNNMGGAGQAGVYEYNGDMQLMFYYVERDDAFNVVNKTVARSGTATQTTLSGITFQWGNIYEGSFLCSITYINGTSNYQATVEYLMAASAFGECPNMGTPYSVNVNYGTFPSSLRSNVDNIVTTQWLGIQVAVSYGEKICQQIDDGCHLWGSLMQTNFEQGNQNEKDRFIQYLTTDDYYGDARVGHAKWTRNQYLHLWYDPSDDYFMVEAIVSSLADDNFDITTVWRFRFGSFIRGGKNYYAEHSEYDFDTGYVTERIWFMDDLIVLRSDHTYRFNDPKFNYSENSAWNSSFAAKFKDELKSAATDMMSFLSSEWNAAGMSFQLW